MTISIVVLHHGLTRLTLNCLDAIHRAKWPQSPEIILVDNGSAQSVRDELVRGLDLYSIRPHQFLILNENVGFARGMNAGIQVATGDVLIALNSDTVIGEDFPQLFNRAQHQSDNKIGFLAVPVFDLEGSAQNERTTKLQAEVTALTWYMSCLPVRTSAIQHSRILGPPGPAIIMTRTLVRAMQDTYGFVFNPDFFLYGEDVDLFLRARRQGFRTQTVPARVEHGEAIWHIGSASSSGSKRTMDKSPELAAYVLSGCLRNIWSHAGWAELLPLLALHVCFRVVFYGIYLRKQSWRALLALLRAPSRGMPYRRREAWLRPIFLWPLIALFYQQPFPWARRKSAVLQHQVFEKAIGS